MKKVQKMFTKLTMPLGGLLAFALLLSPLCAFGDVFLDDDLYYYFNEGSETQVCVGGLNNPSATHITIPATVVYEYTDYNDRDDDGNPKIKRRTCTVTRISLGSKTTLKSVTIRDGITSIGDSAFFGCTSLTSVTIPSSVTSIGDGAFYNCTSLTSVTIPSSVTSIGGSAFGGCTSLTSAEMPGVTSIGEWAFQDCASLASVKMPNVTSIGEWAC